MLATPITIVLTAHFWRADFFRVFGRRFFAGLMDGQGDGGGLIIQSRKLLSFKEVHKSGRFLDPVLEYARDAGGLRQVRVRNFDTALAFGPDSLQRHAETFLGLGKSPNVSLADKQDMLATFRRKPRKSYTYAILDSLLTLRVAERMREEDRGMYEKLGFAPKEIPPLRPTQGSQVAEMITKSIAKAAAGSVLLSQSGKLLAGGGAGKPSLNKVKALLSEGSGEAIAAPQVSAFGRQTGETHGGLLFSRSTTKLFHSAPGISPTSTWAGVTPPSSAA